MTPVVITFPERGNYVPKLTAMMEWCEDNAGIQYTDWQWDWDPAQSLDYTVTVLVAKFKFKRHQVASMFALKFS
jgi:hypothetical protein